MAAVDRGADRPREVRGPDVDVRRDQRGTGAGFVLLAILGGLGLPYVVLFTANYFTDLHLDTKGVGFAWPYMVLAAVVFGVAAISAVRVYNRPQPPTGAAGVGRIIVNTVAITGAIFGGLTLLALAAIIVLFIVCLSGGFTPSH
jgi:hypothetical protein